MRAQGGRHNLRILGLLGAMAALATFLIALLISAAAGLTIRDSHGYSAVLTDSSGLEVGDRVRIAGVEVGRVDAVTLHEGRQAEVLFNLTKAHPIYASSRVTIRYENLIGDRYLEVSAGPGGREILPPGGQIPIEQTSPALALDDLFNSFRPLFEGVRPDEINDLAEDLVAILQGQSGTVESLLTDVGSVTQRLAEREAVIDRVLTNFSAVLGDVDQRDAQLDELLVGLQTLVSGLSEDRAQIGSAVAGISELSATVADVLGEARPPLDRAVEALQGAAGALVGSGDALELALERLPFALRAMGRAGTYGPFFNVYICSLAFQYTDGAGNVVTLPGATRSGAERCQPLSERSYDPMEPFQPGDLP